MSKAFQGIGTKLQRGDGAGPEVFTTIAEMVKVQQSGSKADIVDVTNLDSPNAYKEKLVTILDAGQIAFDGNMVADDATQQNVQGNLLAEATLFSPYINVNPTSALSPLAITNVGGSQPHDNFQPYLCVDFIISLFGIFPSQT